MSFGNQSRSDNFLNGSFARHECCLQFQPRERNMRTSFLLLAGVAAVISVAPANATMRIAGDPGGLIIAYLERFAAVRASGEPVIIDGTCLSACTLAIGILSRGQVCATPKAVLGFHAARLPTMKGGRVASSYATQVMYEIYPANVREWIGRRGGLSSLPNDLP
jgi:hypothetical protein